MFKSDIIPPSSMRKLVIESKFYSEFPFHKLAQNQPIPLLKKWVDQTLQTIDPGDLWMVVIRINRKGSFAVFDQQWLDHLQVGNHVRHAGWVWCDFEHVIQENIMQIRQLTETI
jgi:hypothetical protein